MRLEPHDIRALCGELAARCDGAVVQRAWSGRDDEVLLQLRAPGHTEIVLLAAGTPWARMHLVPERTTRPEEPAPFVALLRKQLVGLRLRGVEARGDDRVAGLVFEGRGERWKLQAELTGRHGNLFLLDAGGVIRGSLRANVSHRRELGVGHPYEAPQPRRADQGADGDDEAPGVLPALEARDDAPAPLSAWLHERVEAAIADDEATRRQTDAARRVRKELERARRRAEKIARDSARAESAGELRRRGELLQSAWGRVERGAKSVTVVDYYDPAQAEVEIPLDPTRDLAQNVDRYFREARRLDAARALIEERLAAARAAEQALAAALARIEAEDAEISELLADLEARRFLPREGRTGQPGQRGRSERAAQPARAPYRRFVSRAGREILVGRGARENDELSLRVARGRDLWLHVDDAAGAHVIVRLEKGESVDQDTLVDAAILAAHYSKRREDGVVEVRYARPTDLRKPRGAPAGLVSVLRSKTVTVRMEQERIERLFAEAPTDSFP